MGKLEFTPRKGIVCPDRLTKSYGKVEKKVEEKQTPVEISKDVVKDERQTAHPIRIAKVVDVDIKFGSIVSPDDITIVVEFDNDTLEITHPTLVECDTSVLGKAEAVIHFYQLEVKHELNIVR